VFYTPAKLYGFCQAEGGPQVFFHAGVFTGSPPPAILGEPVEVEYDARPGRGEGSAPRATLVRRLVVPVLCVGTVTRFDEAQGWGFLRDGNGVAYHLHRSDVRDGRLPVLGSSVAFYPGIRRERPRACHVEVLR